MSEQDIQNERSRSPVYPFISLPEALRYLEGFSHKYGYATVDASVALKDMNYSITSGSGVRILSAFNQFGLFDIEGIRTERRVKLSELGEAILRVDQNTPAALLIAARRPEMHEWMWSTYDLSQKPLPPDNQIEQTLINRMRFNDKAASAFVREFKETYEYVNQTFITASSMPEHPKVKADESTYNFLKEPMKMNPQTSSVQQQEVGTDQLSTRLTKGKIATVIFPKDMNSKDYRLMKLWLDQLALALDDAVNVSENESRGKDEG